MKKLMITAAAVAMTAGAFADPLVYDYKASAKHMYAKQVNVGGQRIYKKFVKSASLKGYLIVDTDGATSAALIADRGDGNSLAPTGLDMGRNRCFLVVQNSKAEADVRAPKLIPGVIDAKWLDTKFRNDRGVVRNPATSDLAEGYLYLGGDFAAATRPALDNLAAGIAERGVLANGRMIGDYAWQSIWLFGKFNMPFVATAVSALWDNAQAAIDGAMALNTGKAVGDGKMFFHDAWMNGAGFGKYVIVDNTVSDCCGFEAGDTPVLLQSLAGNLKGGLFLCTENGIVDTAVYSTYLNGRWEEQFFCARFGGATFNDFDQTDLWQDGELELNTSDCISGSWQIKLNQNASFNAALYVPLTNPEITNLNPAAANFVEDSTGLDALCGTIKGAARRLNSGANARFTDGTEIHAKTAAYIGRHNVVPMLTPSFALYYGLANWQ